MCHILLTLPFVGLLLFLFLPFGQAFLLYSCILILCAIFYWLIWKDMRRPVTTGKEGMIGGIGSVIQNGKGTTKISYKGEIWNAVCDDDVSIGDRVEVTGVERMKMIVRKREKR